MKDKGEFRELVREAEQLEEEAVPPSPALLPAEIPEIQTKKLFLFLVAFYSTAILLRIFVIEGPSFFSLLTKITKPGFSVPSSGSILFGYFIYMCLGCQFFPIPTLPPIAFTAKLFSPLLVAFLGAIGTCIANLNDYAILGFMFRSRRVKKIRDIQTYRKLLDFFDRYAFLTLTAASFLPIPVDVIRLIAISRAYSYPKYLLATFTGRFPRYLIIAYLGKELPAKYILILFLVTALPAVLKFVIDIVRKRRKKPSIDSVEMSES